VEVKAARDEGAVGERGLPDERMQVPQPLLPSLFLRDSWLLPGFGIMTKYFRAGFNQSRSGGGVQTRDSVHPQTMAEAADLDAAREERRSRGSGFAQLTVAARDEGGVAGNTHVLEQGRDATTRFKDSCPADHTSV